MTSIVQVIYCACDAISNPYQELYTLSIFTVGVAHERSWPTTQCPTQTLLLLCCLVQMHFSYLEQKSLNQATMISEIYSAKNPGQSENAKITQL